MERKQVFIDRLGKEVQLFIAQVRPYLHDNTDVADALLSTLQRVLTSVTNRNTKNTPQAHSSTADLVETLKMSEYRSKWHVFYANKELQGIIY